MLPHLDLFPSLGWLSLWATIHSSLVKRGDAAAARWRPFRLGSPLAAHADAVKVGRSSSLAAPAGIDRPHLDGGEYGAMLRASRIDAEGCAMSLALRRLLRLRHQGIDRGAVGSTEHERVTPHCCTVKDLRYGVDDLQLDLANPNVEVPCVRYSTIRCR